MELEKVLVVRADGGRMTATVLVVSPSYADGLAAELASAVGPGEDVMIVRTCGEELVPLTVKIPVEVADRIIGDALPERVL